MTAAPTRPVPKLLSADFLLLLLLLQITVIIIGILLLSLVLFIQCFDTPLRRRC